MLLLLLLLLLELVLFLLLLLLENLLGGLLLLLLLELLLLFELGCRLLGGGSRAFFRESLFDIIQELVELLLLDFLDLSSGLSLFLCFSGCLGCLLDFLFGFFRFLLDEWSLRFCSVL